MDYLGLTGSESVGLVYSTEVRVWRDCQFGASRQRRHEGSTENRGDVPGGPLATRPMTGVDGAISKVMTLVVEVGSALSIDAERWGRRT